MINSISLYIYNNDKFLNLTISYPSSADDKFVKMKSTYCVWDSRYGFGSFRNLTSAKKECSQDPSCKGVLDDDCAGDSAIFPDLCRVGYDYKVDRYGVFGSCVYDKKGEMYSFF